MSPVYDTPALLRWNQLKFPAEKGVFYYVYQKIFTRGTCCSRRHGSACHTDGPLLLFGNADPVRSLCRSMVWLPLRDAARGFQNLPP